MRRSALQTLWSGPWRKLGVLAGLLLMGDLFWVSIWFPSRCRGHIFPASSLPQLQAPVLILGAGVLADKEPTQVLQGRLKTALTLYREHKATWFLVSGDNRTPYYNEPQAMRKWLLKQNVPPEHIVSDFAGRRTYDSLKRAQAIFGLQRVILVTSDFHLSRAIYVGSHLGLEIWGVPASTEQHPWSHRLTFWAREYIARHKALLDLWFPPDTLLGPREPTPDTPVGSDLRETRS